jgi:hypothetical protein
LLTQTTRREAPLWMLGSDDAQQQAVVSENGSSGTIAYVRGIGGLVARDYGGAAQWFAQAERERLALPTIRPLEVYALCLAGRLDDARRLAEDVNVHDADARHFWNWLASTFRVRAQPTR